MSKSTLKMEHRESKEAIVFICYSPKTRPHTEMALASSFTSIDIQGWVHGSAMGWPVCAIASHSHKETLDKHVHYSGSLIWNHNQEDSPLCSSSYPRNYTWLRSFRPWRAILIAKMTTEGFRWESQWKVGWALPFSSHKGLASIEGLCWGMMFWENALNWYLKGLLPKGWFIHHKTKRIYIKENGFLFWTVLRKMDSFL